ncbi:MAG TPA: aldo/keto reductase [Kofleriaceae bacterium]|nr:aldo/keto reductase [Kofleriaceae bacterium]
MRTRQLGEFTISAIGSGDVSLPASAARGVPAREVEHAVHEAITFGITLIEVAPEPDSERLIGEAIREHRARDRVLVASHVPMLAERAGAPRRDRLPERLPPSYVQHCVEASLRTTRLDALPLAQLALHPAWIASPAWPELVATCARLTREGKVRLWGAVIDDIPAPEAPVAPRPPPPPPSSLIISLADAVAAPPPPPAPPDVHADLAALIAEPWLAALSLIFHACDRRAQPVIAHAAARTPPLVTFARRPLAGGALAGHLGPDRKIPPRDDRQALDDATLTQIAVGVARLSPLVKQPPPAAQSCDAAQHAAERARTNRRAAWRDHVAADNVAELALRLAIDRAGVALPRLHRRAHLLPALAAAAAPPLPDAVVEEISEALS